MPNDLKINDNIKKVEELPPQLRKETRGIIPSFWGYNVRVTKSFEKGIMRILNPPGGGRLGPCIGNAGRLGVGSQGHPKLRNEGADNQNVGPVLKRLARMDCQTKKDPHILIGRERTIYMDPGGSE